MFAHVKAWYVIAKGRISGTYADDFHRISSDGKVGYHMDRDPSPEEKRQMLIDIVRHREKLIQELNDLAKAEALLKK
jgi:hypothetical protein